MITENVQKQLAVMIIRNARLKTDTMNTVRSQRSTNVQHNPTSISHKQIALNSKDLFQSISTAPSKEETSSDDINCVIENLKTNTHVGAVFLIFSDAVSSLFPDISTNKFQLNRN